MRLVLQRVSKGAVVIDHKERREIGPGLVIFVGICPEDDEAICRMMADKAARLRIFNDENSNLNRSLLDTGGACLIVSNFTLYAQCRKGRRPSFTQAAKPELAEQLYERFVESVADLGVEKLQTGGFGAHMDVEIMADGPVTIWLDSDVLRSSTEHR